jgi:Family of unknown function (DUF5990)
MLHCCSAEKGASVLPVREVGEQRKCNLGWSRRMKIGIHDIGQDLVEHAAKSGGVIETSVIGNGKDGTPSCVAVRPTRRCIVER